MSISRQNSLQGFQCWKPGSWQLPLGDVSFYSLAFSLFSFPLLAHLATLICKNVFWKKKRCRVTMGSPSLVQDLKKQA